jgi:cbb3-type cytochrome oxidase maturation protein
MSVLFVVVPLAIVIVSAAVWAYVASARSGQFDDLDTPAVRMLHDDEGAAKAEPEITGELPSSRSARGKR